jgi:predicted transcriptional regulator of viral defense system
MKQTNLLSILRSSATVFSFKEILLASQDEPQRLRRRLSYYIQKGQLYPIRRGIYAKDNKYDRLEMATKIFIPCYISFETVLAKAGVIFQYYSTIFVATYQTKEIVCDEQPISFRKIKDVLLTEKAGVENKGTYWMASPERAFLDVLYLNRDYHFDNLSPLNFDKVLALLSIYNNKRMTKKVHAFIKAYREEE